MKYLVAGISSLIAAGLVFGQTESVPTKGAAPGTVDANAPPITGKSTIAGAVVNSKTHEPIKKASVMINGPTSLSAVTDSGGNFSFRALPAGAYWVMANQPDFSPRERRMQMAVNVTVGDGEEKTGVEIALQPGASVSGRVTNEDDQPVANCSVFARPAANKQPGLFGGSVGGGTDSEGAYRIHGISPGRYVIRAQCNQSFPAAHGFMRLNDPDIPTEGYTPATYAGGGSGALSGLQVDAGSDLSGIDFHVQRSRMFSIRASVTGVDASLLPNAQILLRSKNNPEEEDVGMPARYNGRQGVFMFRNVTAGTYEVKAVLLNNEKAYEARQDIQVGTSQVTEVDLKMASGPSLSGSVTVDDPNVQLEGQQVALQPLQQSYPGPTPVAPILKDGTFEIKSVLPGHFSLNGIQGGFFKSVTLNGREVTPSDFEVAGESLGVLHISLSSRFGKVHVGAEAQPANQSGTQAATQGTTQSTSSSAGQSTATDLISAALIPVDGGAPIVNASQGHGPVDVEFLTVPPGKYRLLLFSSENPFDVVNNPSSQKALEERMSSVTVAEASDQRITAVIVGAEELGKLLNAAQ